ncbi:zinc ribbon domain-containing protein [Blastomonas sp. AAP53]|uniref:Zn-ribbon domain-containing OB-fold protein n=1 Tax=Blastomonas sp. AAP53 TaxID=1248760 RepID=UPI0009DB0704|nr:zinc ribbon domain-containing protein [Blastomonas sp. AAP53]
MNAVIPGSDAEDITAYHDALKRGQLLVRSCDSCGTCHHYPRSYCPYCGSGATAWRQATGLAEVYSITIWRTKAGMTVPAYVKLAEGPTVLAIIDGDDAQTVRIGDVVRFCGVNLGSGLPGFAHDI